MKPLTAQPFFHAGDHTVHVQISTKMGVRVEQSDRESTLGSQSSSFHADYAAADDHDFPSVTGLLESAFVVLELISVVGVQGADIGPMQIRLGTAGTVGDAVADLVSLAGL